MLKEERGIPGVLIADSAKAEKELNWKPQYSLEEIVTSAWKWEINRKY
jgi:UDP-glucose 4-epimerase